MEQLIDRIVIDTAWGPQLVLVPSGEPSPAGAWLKPAASVYVKGLQSPMLIAPYGQPGPTKWPWVQGALVLGAGVGALLMLRGVTR